LVKCQNSFGHYGFAKQDPNAACEYQRRKAFSLLSKILTGVQKKISFSTLKNPLYQAQT
jgi:hypothetical protein